MKVTQEKLRPNNWDELYGLNEEYVPGITQREVLRELFKKDTAQCLIFYGPPGTGKTSAALLCAREYLGEKNMRYCTITNASDDRGIGMVRRMNEESKRRIGAKRFVRILDEFDGTLTPTQKAFNAIIEASSENAIYILIVNNIMRIIPAILSRSTTFHFPKMDKETANRWFQESAKKLNVKVGVGVFEKVYKYYGGDLRRIINDFFVKYEGKEVSSWSPPKTFAQEIYRARDPFKKYVEIRKNNYINPLELLHELFELSGYKNAQKFAYAANNLSMSGGQAELINMKVALGAMKNDRI